MGRSGFGRVNLAQTAGPRRLFITAVGGNLSRPVQLRFSFVIFVGQNGSPEVHAPGARTSKAPIPRIWTVVRRRPRDKKSKGAFTKGERAPPAADSISPPALRRRHHTTRPGCGWDR